MTDEPSNWEPPPSEATSFWRTLGYRRVDPGDSHAAIEWDAPEEYSFPDGVGGRIVHGGLVATLLDTAMAGACFATFDKSEGFLTADLRSEFYRPARIGTLRADGRVIRRTRGVAFCAAEVKDAEGNLLASARCTQIVRIEGPGANPPRR
jgi:uncharacterized protein (TIGR00369 family)